MKGAKMMKLSKSTGVIEHYAIVNGKEKYFWANYVAGLLTGNAFDLYAMLTPIEVNNYKRMVGGL